MPTAGKLVAAVLLAGLAVLVSGMVAGVDDPALFAAVNAALGLAVGWRVVGRRAGAGRAMGVSLGVTGALAMVFWGILGHAAYAMVDRALAGRYRGPGAAFDGLLALMAEYAAALATAPAAATLLGGGALAGLLADAAARRWR